MVVNLPGVAPLDAAGKDDFLSKMVGRER